MMDGEEKIIKNAVRGEASAFGSLYDYYHPKIYRFVFLKVNRREEAEDLAHQVFLAAWQNIRSYKDFGFPFSSWLYQIARNQIIDHYRKNKNEVPLEEVDAEIFVKPATAESEVIKNMELARVMKAIKTLKQDYQDVVLMRFVEELSIREVAHAIGKSEGAVKLIQHRALKELKARLQDV